MLSPQVCYSLHAHCILKSLCMAKRGAPIQKTNYMITYFDSYTTKTSDVMFEWYGIYTVKRNLFKSSIYMDLSAIYIKWPKLL